jgi:hypothetical protein
VTWDLLYRSHQGLRSSEAKEWTSEVRKKLIALAKAGHCDGSIQGRFSYQRAGDLETWSIRSPAAAVLTAVPGLASASLTALFLVNVRNAHFRAMTVMVEGKRPDGSPWMLAVHLPDDRETDQNPAGDRQGLGACSHAALHCHVGPDFLTAPEVRVPLPPLGPTQVVEWVLSQLIPRPAFEPAPWAGIKANNTAIPPKE